MKTLLVTALLFAQSTFGQVPPPPTANQLQESAASAAQNAQKSPETGGAIEQVKQKALVNLNTASAADLAKLPGIGAARAKAIIDARPYKSIEDLKKVKGIKEGVIAKLRGLVTT